MRAVRVVVVLVLGQHVSELRLVEDQHPVQALARDGADPPLGVGVGLRRTRRTTQRRNARGGEYSIEARRELRVAIADQNPETVSPLPQREHKIAGLLGCPLPRRMRCNSKDVDPACPDLEDEEYLDRTQQHGVDGEQVTRQHRRRLGTAELPPRRSGSPRSRVKPRRTRDVPHGRRSHPIAKPDEFAVDPTLTHLGFSRANRITRSRMTAAVRGRPPPGFVFGRLVQCRATNCRCQRSNVSEVTILARTSSLGSIRASATSTSRSFGSSRGRLTCRRSTATSWPSTRNSTSPTRHDHGPPLKPSAPGTLRTEQRTAPEGSCRTQHAHPAEVFEPHSLQVSWGREHSDRRRARHPGGGSPRRRRRCRRRNRTRGRCRRGSHERGLATRHSRPSRPGRGVDPGCRDGGAQR
jgi:hypothetical protein